jgi:hypothetical protein
MGEGPAHEAQHVRDNAGHIGTGIVMDRNDTPHERAVTLSLHGHIKVSDGSTIVLCIDGDARVLECQYQQSVNVK